MITHCVKNRYLIKNTKLLLLMFLLISICCIFFTDTAFSAPLDGSKSFNGLLELIRQQSAQWYSTLHKYGLRIFWLLAIIQFIWIFIPLVFRGADISELVGELVRLILIIGFFAALLEYSQEWGTAIVDSFRKASAHASGRAKELLPGDILYEASLFGDAILNFWTFNPINYVIKNLAALIVYLCFAFIAAFMALTIIESYIVINASVIFMGFGASQWTRDFAIVMFRYAVSVGVKLFVLTLIVTLITDSAITWRNAYNGSSASMWTLLGLALACAYLTKTVPDIIAGLISGASNGGGSSIGSMASAGVGAAVAIGAVATGGTSVGAMGAAGGTGGGMGSAMGGMGAAGGAGGGMGSAMGGMGAAGGASGGMGSAMGSNNMNVSRMTGNSFKGENKPQYYSENPRTAGGTPPSTKTNQSKPQSLGGIPTGGTVANVGLKAFGTLSAISVPGMEDAANLDLNTPPPSLEDALLQDAREYYNSQSNETEVVDNTVNTISAGPGKKDE